MNNNMTTETLAIAVWADISEELTDQAAALAIHRGEITYDAIVDAQNEIDGEDYLVLTDEQADERCKEEIEEMVWAFSPSFLQAHTGVAADAITKIQEMCEGANEPLTAMIKDFDYFVEDAINCDGRGLFLAGYDHRENEVTYNGTTYYIYRRN